MKIKEILNIFEDYAPISISDEYVKKYNAYDNSGIIVDSDEEIKGVLFSLDLTVDAVDKAIESGCNLIFTHHPAIYLPIKNICCNTAIYKAVSNKIGVISFHLNLDMTKFGIDYYLAKGLGAKTQTILLPLSNGLGYGRIFDIDAKPYSQIVDEYKKEFDTNKVVCYGNESEKVSTIASLCGQGLGDFDLSLLKDADLIVSSDVPHHIILNVINLNKKLMIVSHYSSEFYGFSKIYGELSMKLNGLKTVLFTDNKYL